MYCAKGSGHLPGADGSRSRRAIARSSTSARASGRRSTMGPAADAGYADGQLQPRRRPDDSLLAIVQEAHVHSVSRRGKVVRRQEFPSVGELYGLHSLLNGVSGYVRPSG